MSRRAIEFSTAFESTYQPAHDRDVAESTRHVSVREWDLDLVVGHGVRRVRYPLRWHRTEVEPGRFDWRDCDAALDACATRGLQPVVDLVHHTSYPSWLTGGFEDPRFGPAFVRWCESVATRYPQLRDYTLFNEPFATLFLAGHEGLWPPYHRGVEGFVRLLRNVLPAIVEASQRVADLLPGARHLVNDTVERASSDTSRVGRSAAALANDRRFFVFDVLCGLPLERGRPFVEAVVAAGGGELLELGGANVDVVGLDYYTHCQWHYTSGGAWSPSPHQIPLSELLAEYSARYRRPMVLAETNIRGFASDRATWLKHTLDQCERARAAGVPIDGYCWFPFIDSCDWDSLLHRCDGNVDPVGVLWLDENLRRRSSVMSRSFRAAAAGAPAAELPAFTLHEPVATWLRGLAPAMSGYEWRPSPEAVPGAAPAQSTIELRIVDAS